MPGPVQLASSPSSLTLTASEWMPTGSRCSDTWCLSQGAQLLPLWSVGVTGYPLGSLKIRRTVEVQASALNWRLSHWLSL